MSIRSHEATSTRTEKEKGEVEEEEKRRMVSRVNSHVGTNSR